MAQAPTVSTTLPVWNLQRGITPEDTFEAARIAEESGLDGILTGDHVTFYGGGTDGLVTLTAVASRTKTLMLQTAVYLLPLRHVVPVALQVAMVDQLSGGRLIFGVGVGGEDPHEFTSCGVNPRQRGARTNEALEILKRLQVEEEVSYEGRHFQLDKVSVNPKPEKPTPIFIGGRSEAALIRAGRFGDAYNGIWLSLDRFNAAKETIKNAAVEAGRGPDAVEMGMTFWVCIDDDTDKARSTLAESMEAGYRVPFERFERYSAWGSPDRVAETISPFVEAGVRHISFFQPAGGKIGEAQAAAARVRESLHERFKG